MSAQKHITHTFTSAAEASVHWNSSFHVGLLCEVCIDVLKILALWPPQTLTSSSGLAPLVLGTSRSKQEMLRVCLFVDVVRARVWVGGRRNRNVGLCAYIWLENLQASPLVVRTKLLPLCTRTCTTQARISPTDQKKPWLQWPEKSTPVASRERESLWLPSELEIYPERPQPSSFRFIKSLPPFYNCSVIHTEEVYLQQNRKKGESRG